jgi:phosphatidylglycerophosphate synthase
VSDLGSTASLERRPIAARGWRMSRRLTTWLVGRGVSPNAISLSGMAFAVIAGAILAATPHLAPAWERLAWLAAAILIVLRLLANMLDGMVAVEAGTATRVGEIFNEVPDRVSDSAVLIGLGYAHDSDPVLGFVAALAAVFTAYVRAAGKAAGAPQFYQGPMAKPHRMWLVVLLCAWAAAAPGTLAGTSSQGLGATIPALVLVAITTGCAITSARRLVLIGRALRGPGE